MGLRIAGHSLGGGLASAALVAARATSAFRGEEFAYIECNTFNSAGLHRNTLFHFPQFTPVPFELVPVIAAIYDQEKAGLGVIDAWFLEYDVLSFVQDHSTKMPQALRRRHMLQDPKVPSSVVFAIDRLSRLLRETPFEGDSLDDVWIQLKSVNKDHLDDFAKAKNVLFNSHKTAFYFFGLMVVRDNVSNSEGPFLWDIWSYWSEMGLIWILGTAGLFQALQFMGKKYRSLLRLCILMQRILR